MNKLPWDDANDINSLSREPGVYAVCVSAIQDAVLSIKIASNLLRTTRGVHPGIVKGLVGIQAPAFDTGTSLFQIEDDDNVLRPSKVEIHADNEDSFVDKERVPEPVQDC